MTKSLQQIRQNLESLESTVVEAGQELEKLYQNYFQSLSSSVKQQLILASYQVCTQFYAKSFLALSLNDKQRLQQALRKISTEVEPALSMILEQKELDPEPREIDLMAELIKNLPKPKRKLKSSHEDEKDNEAEQPEIDLESVKAELEKIELIEIDTSFEEPDLETNDSSNSNNSNSDSDAIARLEADFSNPAHLILWHKQIERTVKKTLDYTSRKANRCLQDFEIISERIPSKIIDVAIQADSGKGGRSGHKIKNSPNILHLVIEGNQDKGESKSAKNHPKNTTKVSLLRLRTSELEFSDPLLNAQRTKIRNAVSKINHLDSKYRATQKEADIAAAQAAWRSSWYED